MKKPLLQRQWVWGIIICIIAIGLYEVKSQFNSKAKEREQEQLAINADKVLKGKVKIPDTYFKTKEEVTELFKAADLKPNFVVSNFDDSASINKHYLKEGECDDVITDQPSVEYYDTDKVGDKYGFYADKGSTIIVGYSDHDFDGTGKKKTSASDSKKNIISTKDEQAEKSSSTSSMKEIIDDITILSDEPTAEQQTTLDELAQQQFDKTYPYKGSKMHTILGVIQPWTQNNGNWYMKVEATIANEANAKRKANVEIHITPTGSTSGTVELISY